MLSAANSRNCREYEALAMKEKLLRAATSLTLICLVALGLRLGFAFNKVRQIPQEIVGAVEFEQETGSIAYALATGKGFSSPFRKETGPTAWLTPVYPLLVAGTFRIFGVFTRGAFFAVVFLNALFSAAVCAPVYFAGKRIGGLVVGSAAAWLWAIFPNAVMMPYEWVWDTCLAALLAATLFWTSLELAESRRWRDWCGYGLLWGFTLMTNPALGALLPFLLAWAAFRAQRSLKLGLAKPALAAGIAVLCCVPWAVRNYLVFGRFVPLRSNFPLELYIGNNNNYASPQYVWPPKISKEREILRYFRLGETAFMDEEMRKAMEFIRAHPKIFMELNEARFVEFWTGLPAPIDAFRTTDSVIVRVLLLCNTTAALGGLLGIVMLIVKRSPWVIPAAAYPAIFPVVYYITHPNLRYRHPIDPIVLLLAVVGVTGMYGVFAGKTTKRKTAAESAQGVA